MATYVPFVPPGAIPCGTGQFSAVAPNEATARINATHGDSAQVNYEVEGRVGQQVRISEATLARVKALRRPKTIYTLDSVTPGLGGLWVVQFRAYVVEGATE
jgi:hypothetical protein